MASQAWTGSHLGQSHWARCLTRTRCIIQVRCHCHGTHGARGPLTTQVHGLQCSVTATPSPRGPEAVLPGFLPLHTTMEGSALPRSSPIERVRPRNPCYRFHCFLYCSSDACKSWCITEHVLLVNLRINCCDNCNRVEGLLCLDQGQYPLKQNEKKTALGLKVGRESSWLEWRWRWRWRCGGEGGRVRRTSSRRSWVAPAPKFPGSSFQYNLPPFRARFPNEGPRRAAFPVITV